MGVVQRDDRTLSHQDLRTRNARASLGTFPRRLSTTLLPIYSPSPTSAPSASHPLRDVQEMERPRLYSRPNSSTSSICTRSSFESRHKSPLSLSSSIDHGSSRTSLDSSFSSSSSGRIVQRAHGLRATSSLVEPVVPPFARYRVASDGYRPKTLMTPQRLGGSFPSVPTNSTSLGIRYVPRAPGEGFKKLPEEILLVVLGELKKLHLELGSLSCTTCWARDLVNLGLSCQKWWGAARIVLYEDIRVIGSDSLTHTKKKFKTKYGTRLKLLRRTLRARPDLAQYVKVLKVPSMPDAAKTKAEQDEYVDLVASLVMACPNLERLPGFYTSYNHEFSRITHALSTRSKLVERVWIIDPGVLQRQHRYAPSGDSQYSVPVTAPRALLHEQSIAFLMCHSDWTHLQTLFIHCNPGGTLDSALFTDVVRRLPALQNLYVSSIPAQSFNDTTLLSLPPLQSLRLESLTGVTSTGLSAYASSLARPNLLKSLSLINLPILSLPVLARLFSHLTSLESFTLSQSPSPVLPAEVEIFLHPYLASSSLQYLHWEITNPGEGKATEIFAKSLASSGFPSLRTIRAPTDFDGSIQRLCKPREKIELPGDRYRNLGTPGPNAPSSQTVSMVSSPTRSTFSLGSHTKSASTSSSLSKSETRSSFSLKDIHYNSEDGKGVARNNGMSLATSRRMAQSRIDTAATNPNFQIIVWDENGTLIDHFAVGAFLGQIQSKVFYSLKPDVDGTDVAVVSVDSMGGLLDGGEETNVKDGCTGSWNMDIKGQGKTGKSMKKGNETWWHTERGRWKEMPLEKFF